MSSGGTDAKKKKNPSNPLIAVFSISLSTHSSWQITDDPNKINSQFGSRSVLQRIQVDTGRFVIKAKQNKKQRLKQDRTFSCSQPTVTVLN